MCQRVHDASGEVGNVRDDGKRGRSLADTRINNRHVRERNGEERRSRWRWSKVGMEFGNGREGGFGA
jgi:hypothetical protein